MRYGTFRREAFALALSNTSNNWFLLLSACAAHAKVFVGLPDGACHLCDAKGLPGTYRLLEQLS